MNPIAYVWRCEAGHKFAVSELQMRTAVVEPRCQCGGRLVRRLYPLGDTIERHPWRVVITAVLVIGCLPALVELVARAL